jgi:preprotein translocase subunit SecD
MRTPLAHAQHPDTDIMGKNSAIKLAIIIVVLLFFVYGIIGIPKPTGKGVGDTFKQALARNIHLGLDLKGGIHLVLGVQVQEALNSETDRKRRLPVLVSTVPWVNRMQRILKRLPLPA